MAHIHEWLGLPVIEIDPGNITAGVRESDSHYRMKYPHRQAGAIVAPGRHDISPRIQRDLSLVLSVVLSEESLMSGREGVESY
jgi:sulfotransferase